MLLPIVLVGVVVVSLETVFPARLLPKVRGWWFRLAVIQVVMFAVVFTGHATWEKWLGGRSLLHLPKSLSPFWGGVIAYLVGSLVLYWWHRARHGVPLFWRLFHQLHHSPERVEALTAFYVHPAEMVSGSILNTALVCAVLGLGMPANAWCNFFLSFAGFFYHMNLNTPRWVGYFLQRPEMHRVHHQRHRHSGNYSDLPIWDHLFGTYVDPSEFSGQCGFEGGKENEFARILAFADVHGY